MVTWDEERKRLGVSNGSGTNFSAGQPDVDKKAGITSWDEERIRLGALPDIRPSTQLRQNLPSPMQSGFGGFQNTTLGQAAAGNPSAAATYRNATGITLRPNVQPSQLDDKSIQQARNFFGSGITDNVLVPVTKFIDNSLLGKAATRTSLSAANALNLYPDDNRAKAENRPTTGSKVFDTTLDIGGALGGYASNPAGVGVAGQGLLSGSYGIADKLTGGGTKLGGIITNSIVKGVDNPATQRILNTAVTNGYRGGIAGGIAGVNSSLIRGESSPQEIGVSAAAGVGLGAIGDAVFGGLAQSAIKKLFQSNKLSMKEAEEILGLPMASKQSLAREGLPNRLPDGEGVITNPYTFKLPEAIPSTAAATSRYNSNVGKLSQLDSELATAEAKQAQMIIDEYKSLKQIRDTKGLKPDWYRQLNDGKRPTNRQLFELAGNRVTPDTSLNNMNVQRRTLQNEVDQFGNVTTSSPTKVTRLSTNATIPEPAPAASLGRTRTSAASEPINPAAVKADDYEPPAAFTDQPTSQQADTPAAMPDNVPMQQAAEPVNPSNRIPIANPANERGFVSTLANSDKTPDEFVQQLRNSDNASYEPITNAETLSQANTRLENVDQARAFVMDGGKFTAEKAATAQRLIDHYNARDMIDQAVEVADRLAEEATAAGQFIQSLSLYNRLTPEGLIRFVTKRVNKINQKMPTNAKKLTVTDDIKKSLVEIGTITQKMTGVRNVAADVAEIVSKLKNGEVLSEADSAALQTFVKNTKEFVKDATSAPKNLDTPSLSANQSIRQRLSTFLDGLEQGARDRINRRKNRLSSTPLDIWADQIIIGAAKMGKGAIKFADWSEDMVREFGETIRPVLPAMFNRSKQTLAYSRKRITMAEYDGVKAAVGQLKTDTEKVNVLAQDFTDRIKNTLSQYRQGSADAQSLDELKQVASELVEALPDVKPTSTTAEKELLQAAKTLARKMAGDDLATPATPKSEQVKDIQRLTNKVNSILAKDTPKAKPDPKETEFFSNLAHDLLERPRPLKNDKMGRLVNRIVKENKQGFTEDQLDTIMVMARKASQLAGEEKRLAAQDLQKILQEFDRPTIGRKISSLQTTAQLLNPKTQVRNIVGNELFYRTERLTKLLASPIDAAISKLTGKDRHITFRNYNQGEYWRNWMLGLKSGWEGTNINGLQSQFDLQAQAFRSKYNPLTYLEKALGASLRSFDNAGYMRAYNKALGEMGTLDALNNGVKGDAAIREHVKNYIAFADDAIHELADQYGKYVTFQDNNALSVGLSKAKKGLNLGRSFGFGDFVLKYPKTPGAILMRALEYSPAGFVRSAILMNKALRYAEKEKLPEAAMAIARAALGTAGFAGMGYYLMDNGVLTTSASKDLDVKRLQAMAGQSQYQINFSALKRLITGGLKKQDPKPRPGDIMYSYDWAQPIALSLSLGGEAQKNMKEGKEGETLGLGLDFANTAFNSVAGAINTLTEQSVLQGIRDAVGSSYPGQTTTSKVLDVLSTVPASFVPTAFNQIRQYTDPTARETYAPTLTQKAYNQTINKIPGLQDNLPIRYNTLGEEQQVMQTPSAFNIFLNPGNQTTYKLSPNAQMVMDLINNLEDDSLAPRVPDKSIQGNKLTGTQYSRLSQLQGQLVNDKLSQINPEYSDAIKARVIDDILTNAGKQARKQIMQEYNLNDNRKK